MIHIANIRPPSRGGNVGNAGFAFSIISSACSALLDARALNQCCGLAFADQGHPRAALDVYGFLDFLFGA